MKIKVNVSRLPEAPYSRPRLPADKKPDKPYEALSWQTQKQEEKQGKRDWSKVRRGSHPNWFYTPEQDAVIKNMRAQGKTYAEIGNELGRSPGGIRHRLKVIL